MILVIKPRKNSRRNCSNSKLSKDLSFWKRGHKSLWIVKVICLWGQLIDFVAIVSALSKVYLVPQEGQKRDLQVKGTYE